MAGQSDLRGGPRIVAIGGGTGLSTMLRGLKRYSSQLTAVVTTADDGGGSGMLRTDLGMPPPGDIRHCMQALANTEPLMEALINYRFTEGSLAGQSFGNLFLAALMGVTGSFEEAVARMGDVLAITGRVLPVTTENIQLVAEFVNGTRVVGESKISDFKKEQDCPIARVRLSPERPAANPEALEAIAQADLILLGPGSLYTSIIPNLLVEGIADAVAASPALRIYVCNVMTQSGETEGYSAGDHLKALLTHGGSGLVDCCLVNSTPIPESLTARYAAVDCAPILIDAPSIRAMGVEPLLCSVADLSQDRLARHDPTALARAIMNAMEERTVRTLGRGVPRYVREH